MFDPKNNESCEQANNRKMNLVFVHDETEPALNIRDIL